MIEKGKQPSIAEDLLDTDALKFADFDLENELLRAITDSDKLGFKHPTLVQSKAIPLALQGKDIMARARTGSGKTAAYCIPVIQKILVAKKHGNAEPAVRALIMVPTRELAEQVSRHVKVLTTYCSDKVSVVNIATDERKAANHKALLAEKPDILIATPKGALDHLESESVSLKTSLESLVIDEADYILSYGYDDDIQKVLTYLPQIYQSYLMSATLSSEITSLKQLVLRNPAILKLSEHPDDQNLLTQYYIKCTEEDKFLLTYFMLKLRVHPFGTGKCIIFVNDVERCYRLKLFLEQFGIKACTLNSGLPLKSRYHIVQEFNRGVYDFLIATDEGQVLRGERDEEDEAAVESVQGADDNESGAVNSSNESTTQEDANNKKRKVPTNPTATTNKKSKPSHDTEYGVSRGIDFISVQSVINFDLPHSSKSYDHRVGRTARGVGNKGFALSFITTPSSSSSSIKIAKSSNSDAQLFSRIEARQNKRNKEITEFKFDMQQVEGFRYRCTDALRAVTKVAIKEARLKELRQEILNSEKLKAHFEDNPRDLHALRHDKPLRPTRVQPHMKHVPDYLLPKKSGASTTKIANVPFKMKGRNSGRGRGGGPSGRGRGGGSRGGRKSDPLKTFKYAA
ncbi:ATP-dependent DNA/RNA helicase [Gaertneriomyces sp. JEL0708]|nr:ATP-dependent DNA/RNA helicase [Gaertneriomyces sp. JEL0708]